MQYVLPSHLRKGWLAYAGIPIVFGIWAALSYSGAVDALLLPPPDRVLLAINDIGLPLLYHIAATLKRILFGFLGASAVGLTLGVLMQYSARWYMIFDGLIETWRPVPPVALVPFFILIFGFAETGRFLLVVLGTTLVIVVAVVEAIDRVQPALIRFGLVCGLSRAELFRLVLLPAALPNTAAGFRIALALSITLVVVSEFLGAQYGLGYLINVSKVTLTTPTIFLCIIILGVIGFLLDFLLRCLFHFLRRWEFSSREAMR